MTKVLFSSCTTTVVDFQTLQPVMEELVKTTDYDIVALINLNQNARDFPRGRIDYKNINEYKTKNINRILEIEKPDLIVVANNSIIETAFMIAGRSKSIPTILVNHAVFPLMYRRKLRVLKEKVHRVFLNGISGQLLFLVCSGLTCYIMKILKRSMVTGYDAGMEYATRICTSSDNMKASLISQGTDENRIKVTGQPRFDVLYSDKWKESKKKVYRDIGVSLDNKLVLIVTQPYVEDRLWSKKQRDDLISGILLAIQEIRGHVSVIKIHPRENIDSYKTLLERLSLKEIPVVKSELHLYDLLSASDLIVGLNSTVLLEAMILNKNVIVANFFNEPDHFGFVSSGAALSTDNLEELSSVVKSILYDGKYKEGLSEMRRQFVYDNAYLQDGQASRRVVDLIVQVIEKRIKE